MGEASKATGISKAGLSRAIKRGALSAVKQENGSYKIDPAELHRVYPAVSEQRARVDTDATGLQAENIELRAKLEASTQRLTDKDGVIDDLRRRLDMEGEERRKLTAILTDQRAKTSLDVIVTPPPTSNTIPTPAAAPSPAAPTAQVEASLALAAKQPTVKPLPVVKVRKPPKEEVSWLRKLIGGK